jgi:hypothetical protein
MKRIGYMILFLFIAAGSQAQLVVTASDTSACEGTEITIMASGADEYSWSSTVSLDTNAGNTVMTTPPVGSHTIMIIGFDTALNMADTEMISIVINPNPSLVIMSSAASDNNFICLGSSATLNAVSDTGTLASVFWSPSTGLDTNTGVMVMASPAEATTYTALVTNIYGCQVSASKIVQVGSSYPVFSVSVSPSEICPGDSATLLATGVGIVSSYVWSPSATLSASSGTEVMAGPAATTTYTVVGTKLGWKVDTSFTVTVLNPPSMNYTQSSNGSPIKLDETDVITVVCPSCESYVWKFPNSTLQTTSNVQTVSPNEPGAIAIKIIGSDAGGCRSNVTATVNVLDAFAGTPFSIGELDAKQVKVIQNAEVVKIQSGSIIEEVRIYNLLGEMVSKSNGLGSMQLEINTGNMTTGVYVLVTKTNTTEASEKIYVR